MVWAYCLPTLQRTLPKIARANVYRQFKPVRENKGDHIRGHRLSYVACAHIVVYTGVMKNITLSAPDHTIDDARAVAAQKNTTVNALVREWLDSYVAENTAKKKTERLKALEDSFEYFSFKSDRKYTREEMHER